MSTPINVIIDDVSVIDDVESLEISQSEGSICNTISIKLCGYENWLRCDPTTDFGTVKLKVVIGDDSYEFLIEERNSSVSSSGINFTVWGRSSHALLSKPYSFLINDNEDSDHPWQTGNVKVSEIVSYVVDNFCNYDVVVEWNVEDFIVYNGTFTVSNQSPIEVISSLANTIGAVLSANIDGTLSIDTYTVDPPSVAVYEYNDIDDIVSLSESIGHPSGYNAITIVGYDDGDDDNSINGQRSFLSISDDRLNEICEGDQYKLRVYYYHANNLRPKIYFCSEQCISEPTVKSIGSGEENISENMNTVFGVGSTGSYRPNSQNELIGNESSPCGIVPVSYQTQYEDFLISPCFLEDGVDSLTISAMCYFDDKSASEAFSFTVNNCDTNLCGSIKVEAVADNDLVLIYVYGAYKPISAISSNGKPVVFQEKFVKKIFNESVEFVNGVASIQYPIHDNTAQTPFDVTHTPLGRIEGVHELSYEYGSTEVSISKFINSDDLSYRYVSSAVSYCTSGYLYYARGCGNKPDPTVHYTFEFEECGVYEDTIACQDGHYDEIEEDVIFECECQGSELSCTTLFMETEESQKIFGIGIDNPSSECDFWWKLDGGGFLSDGYAPYYVTYTAPDEVEVSYPDGPDAPPEVCQSDTTISLYMGQTLCASIEIIIYPKGFDASAVAYEIKDISIGPGTCKVGSRSGFMSVATIERVNCLGVTLGTCQATTCYYGNDGDFHCYIGGALCGSGTLIGTTDLRTPEMIASGCCP